MRFSSTRCLPLKKDVKVRNDLKPVLLVPPYMLGVHILSFLPHDNKSYAHSFANEGIPTYVRVVKDILTNEKVQAMTPEGDCDQTVELCAKIKELNGGKKVTLNGTCQGGYISLMNILSGKLQGVCDALITNVTPIDGTYSEAICGMPNMHHDFITTTLPNGGKVANGYLLSLGMRLVAIDRETPLVKVLDQASLHRATALNPGKTPAALFRWLLRERVHLPLEIAKMSSSTFREPIAEDGTLPVQLYGQPLNVKGLIDLKIPWYQNYAIKDDLVTPACATAGNKFLEGLGHRRVGGVLRRARGDSHQPVRQEGAGQRRVRRRHWQAFARTGEVPDRYLRIRARHSLSRAPPGATTEGGERPLPRTSRFHPRPLPLRPVPSPLRYSRQSRPATPSRTPRSARSTPR